MPGYTTSTEVQANTTLVTTAETVIATLTGISLSAAGRTVRFTGEVAITTGTNTTGLTLRIRRDSLTGTVINEANVEQVEAAAGSTESHDVEADDTPTGEIYNATYVLTVEQAGATANGTAVYGYLKAECE